MDIRVTYRGGQNGWMGVIKAGKRTVWECGHWHANRNHSTMTNGQSATNCAGLMAQLVCDASYLDRLRKWAYSQYSWRASEAAATVKQAEAYAPTADQLRASL